MENIIELKKQGIVIHSEYPLPQSYMHNGITLEALVSKSLSESIFSPEDRVCYAQALGRYAALPIIIDTFETHSERRDYWNTLPPEMRDSFNANRLRKSVSNNLISVVQMFKYSLPELYLRFKSAADSYEELLLDYNDFPLERKIVMVKELSIFAKQVCIALSRESKS